MSLSTLITDPESFFGRRLPEASLIGPALVATLFALASAAAAYPSMRLTFSATGGEAGGIMGAISAISLFVAFLVGFVFWLLYAGAFHAITAVAFDGEGSFTDTLAVAGWGLVPQVVGTAVSAALSYQAFSEVEISQGASGQAVSQTMQQVQSDPLMLTATLIGIVALLWSAVLWIQGVTVARDVTTKQAAIAVAVPVALALATQVPALL